MSGLWRQTACLFVVACLSAGAGETTGPSRLEVRGEAGKAVSPSAKEWAKLPRVKVEVKGKGGKVAAYEGVSLAEVLKLAGISFAEHPRGRASAYVLVEGADGYRAVLALAEIDPKVAVKVVLLADRLDGKPLPDGAGPRRLVVAGDKVPVRWVKQVVRVAVHRHPEVARKK
jgi:DMSO/TMAO reductase YedYZ molybdopterin-dependent catalytic subunit